MKSIVILYFIAAVSLVAQNSHAATTSSDILSAQTSQPPVKYNRKEKKPRPPMPITPGSQVIEFKGKMKAEIRPDKSVWWFGVNYKKAIMADGVHELKDGQKITTKGGKIVGKMPKPDPALQPQKPQK